MTRYNSIESVVFGCSWLFQDGVLKSTACFLSDNRKVCSSALTERPTLRGVFGPQEAALFLSQSLSKSCSANVSIFHNYI